MAERTKAYKYNEVRSKGGDKVGVPTKNLQLKGCKTNSINTTAYVQILGTGMDTHDTLPSVLLFFDNQRFIFNVGEGFQRYCSEHKIKLSKIDHICLSRVCSETVGGLPGLLLTLAGMGEGMSVNIWGPSDLKLLVDAMKSFIPHAAMVHTHLISHADMDHTGSFPVAPHSNAVKISAILLQPSCQEGYDRKPIDTSVIYVCELPEIMGKFNAEKAKALGLTVKTKYKELTQGKSVKSDSLDIMVHPSDVIGPSIPGPIVIIIDCPTNSHAEELLATQSLGAYYSEFMGSSSECTKTVNCIIHLTPPSVVRSSSYEKWMNFFKSAQHIMAGHATKNMEIPILKSSSIMAARLNYLCPQFFPFPAFWSLQQQNNSPTGSMVSSKSLISQPCKSTIAENLLKFTLRPHSQLGLDKSNVPSLLAPSEIIDELLLEVPEIVDAVQQVSQIWHKPAGTADDLTAMEDGAVVFQKPYLDRIQSPIFLKNIRRDDLEIVFLGTGSSQPSKYRNVTSIYIDLFSKGSMLLDCGEGTLAQLRRRYGMEGADNAVRNLRCIWISHIHADHHAGVARILALRHDLLKAVPHEQLLVIGPVQLEQFLDAYQKLEDLDMCFLDCRKTMAASWDVLEYEIDSNLDQLFSQAPKKVEDINNKIMQSMGTSTTSFVAETCLHSGGSKKIKLSIPVESEASPLLKKLKVLLREAGLDRLISFRVVHCPEAFGVVLKSAERINSVGEVLPGWKLVYSGDTRPCPEVIEASLGATILIHEATFEDCMVGEAIAKNHSTTKEAIEVGDSADAYRTILTHFSQRYPKIPVLDEVSMKKTCIAFDLMSINIADLPMLPSVLPYLKLLFRKDMILDNLDDV